MNRLNWIQQEQKVADYHVLTWRTSHFHHPRNRTELTGAFHSKLEGGAAVGSGASPQTEGLGLGLEELSGRTRWRQGGLGTDGIAQDGKKDGEDNAVLSVDNGKGRQSATPEAVAPAVQTVMPEEVYSVLAIAGQSVRKVHSRIRQGVAKLRDAYLKRQPTQGQNAGRSGSVSQKRGEYRRTPKREQKGTRRADRDEALSMQAENHYLLDSYNRNGQYSMLGK